MTKLFKSSNLKVRQKRAIVIGFCIAFIFYAVFSLMISIGLNELDRVEQNQVNDQLSEVKSSLEYEMNSRLYLSKGIEAYILLRDGIDVDDFELYAKHLVSEDDVIRNISLLKDTTIVKAYPLKGNESSIGVDLLKVEGQRESILHTINGQKTVINGPVNLVQGGIGIISRTPFFLLDEEGNKDYWGMSAVVIDWEKLLKHAGFIDVNSDIELAIRVKYKRDQVDTFLWGDQFIFEENPILSKVTLVNADWEIGAVPFNGWTNYSNYSMPANIVAVVIAIALGYLIASLMHTKEHLRHTMRFDSLTGLGNRTYFYDALKVYINSYDVKKEPFALFFVDVDHFKMINDTYGHIVGDFVLREIGQRLNDNFSRKYDVFRIGGDEFTVIDSSSNISENIQDTINKIHGIFKDDFVCEKENLVLNIACSVGVAVYPLDAEDEEALVTIADEHMYKKKNEKKDYVHKG